MSRWDVGVRAIASSVDQVCGLSKSFSDLMRLSFPFYFEKMREIQKKKRGDGRDEANDPVPMSDLVCRMSSPLIEFGLIGWLIRAVLVHRL